MSRVELYERIREDSREEGLSTRALAAESTVRAYVAQVNFELDNTLRIVTVPQTHGPGEEAECDFGEFMAWIDGVLTRCWMFCLRLNHSGRGFHVAFCHQAQEAFFEGHTLAFDRVAVRGSMLGACSGGHCSCRPRRTQRGCRGTLGPSRPIQGRRPGRWSGIGGGRRGTFRTPRGEDCAKRPAAHALLSGRVEWTPDPTPAPRLGAGWCRFRPRCRGRRSRAGLPRSAAWQAGPRPARRDLLGLPWAPGSIRLPARPRRAASTRATGAGPWATRWRGRSGRARATAFR